MMHCRSVVKAFGCICLQSFHNLCRMACTKATHRRSQVRRRQREARRVALAPQGHALAEVPLQERYSRVSSRFRCGFALFSTWLLYTSTDWPRFCKQDFVTGKAVCQKPVLLDLCSGTKIVGSCIDQDEWTYVADINSDLAVPDIQCDLRTWERSGEHKVCCPQGSVDCIWFRSVLRCSTQH